MYVLFLIIKVRCTYGLKTTFTYHHHHTTMKEVIWIKENRTDRKCVHWFEPCMKEFLCFMRISWRYLASIVEKKKACAGSYVVFFYDDCFLHSPFIVEIYETPEEILTLFAWYKIYPVLWCIEINMSRICFYDPR